MPKKRKTKQPAWLAGIVVGICGLFFVAVTLNFFHIGQVHFSLKGDGADPATSFADSPVTLLFVGDIMLSRNIGKLMVKNNDWSYPYAHIGDVLRKADITFANFENPVSDRGVLSGSIYSFRVDPQAIPALRDSGIDVVSLANNHIWDYGLDAFMDTLSILRAHDIAPVGAAEDVGLAHTAVIREVRGTKIAYLAYTRLVPGFLGENDAAPAVAYPDPLQIAQDVTAAKKQADIVVTSFHWGDEYQTIHNPEQEALAHAAIDAGADLVIGHHPHVIQDMEVYKGKNIAYSLGNFIFDQNFSEDTHHGLILKVTVKGSNVLSVERAQVEFNSTYQPFIPQ